MGTPDFAVPAFNKLINSSEHQLAAVFTAPPKAKDRKLVEVKSPIHQLALKYGIDVYTPITLKTVEITNLIAAIEADIIIVVAYGFIITKDILQLKKYGCLNIHPSSLPKYRGAAPLQRTIINGEQETSVCIMQMDEGLDTGDIILQQNISLHERITLPELHNQCAAIGADLLIAALEQIGTLPRKAQSKDGISYAHKLAKEEAKINWHQSAYQIDCKVRGMNPWPGTYFEYEERIIKILEAEYNTMNHKLLPGTVIDQQLTIACGEGTLSIKRLQQAGKKALSTAEFLRGVSIPIGYCIK